MKSSLTFFLVLLLHATAAVAIAGAISPPAGVASPSGLNRLFATSANLGIVEIDPASGAVLNSFAAPVNQGVSDGLAFDGTTLYYLSGSWASNTLYALDPDSGAVATSFALPASGFRNGLAALNGLVYILDWGILTQDITIFDPAAGAVAGTLDIDGVNPGAPLIGGGLAGIHGPDALLVTTNPTSGPYEILEIDAATGQITARFVHGLGAGAQGVAALDGQIYVGLNTGNTITVYDRDGAVQRTLTVPGAVGFQSLGGDDAMLPIDIAKSVMPEGTVNRGDLLTYTVQISTIAGSQLGIYDPLTGTTFVRFAPPLPAGIIHDNGAITGTLTVSPTSEVSLTFVVEVSAGASISVANAGCAYALPGAVDECRWSNQVSNEIREAPGTPALLLPPDVAITSTQAITFTWQPAGGWAADGYNLDLDGAVVTTTATAWPAVLAPGAHQWSVRAYNAAGYSPWAAARSMEVRRFTVYLPLVLRMQP